MAGFAGSIAAIYAGSYKYYLDQIQAAEDEATGDDTAELRGRRRTSDTADGKGGTEGGEEERGGEGRERGPDDDKDDDDNASTSFVVSSFLQIGRAHV